MTLYVSTLLLFVSVSGCGAKGPLPLRGHWYKIQRGDTLSEISRREEIPQEDIVELNALHDPSKIHVGQRLFIPHSTVSRGETLKEVFDVSTETAGISSNAQSSDPLSKEALLPILAKIQWPLKSVQVSSPFGPRGGKPHEGLDLKAPEGTEVRSALAGTITRSEFNTSGYGWLIVIDHGGGIETRYAHHRRNQVELGAQVKAGQVIAEVGSTGRSTGAHLHFELRIKTKPVDPLIYLPALPPLL
jgi:murein DD-endopeptidase MepM/ murein hydrolase activator NlpD